MTRPKFLLPLAALSWLVFLPLLVGVSTHASWVAAFDAHIVAVAISWRPPALTRLWLVITTLGDPLSTTLLAVAAAVVLACLRRRRQALFVAVTVACGSGINHLIKQAVARPRPFRADVSIHPLTSAGGYSFPSGHSAGAMLLYGSLIVLTLLWAWPRRACILARCFGGVMILATGWSRIYVQVHYPTDVVAGFLLALGAVALLAWGLWPWLQRDERR